jgi:hypothetical protein
MKFDGTVKSDFLKFLPNELESKERFIDFTSSDFVSLRNNLLRYVRANFPRDYTNFNESDFGILLVELMAAVGHIQSHKADYLANENFLRTARERSSVKKLMELIGIRMKGPIAAAANAQLSFTPAGANVSGLELGVNQRTINVTSPLDGGALSYTLYKVKSDGSIDLENTNTSLDFVFEETDNPVISSAILLEGALVVERGTFRSPNVVKTVRLSQSPYIEKSAQVFIEGDSATQGIYTEEESIYFASSFDDKVYQVVSNDSGNATVVFGDNLVGKTPAVGDSYTILYRVGGGSRGNIPESYINALVEGTSRVVNSTNAPGVTVTVENISQGTGGAEAESIARVKRYGPLRFRSQNRLVTLKDYVGFANRFASNYGSTGKATASVRKAYSSANNIDIFVLEKASSTQLRQATQEYKRQLLEAIAPLKMLTDEPIIVDGLIRTVDLDITIKLEKRFRRQQNVLLTTVSNIVRRFMSIDNREFGVPLNPQDIIRSILKNPKIRFATVDNIEGQINAEFNEIIQLNNVSVRAELI